LICYLFKPFLITLVGYYLCKWGYQYYLNELSDGPKTKIMPTIFALLPLTTNLPTTSLGYFFMYPFTYPKNENDAKQLPIIMNNYMESLKKAFSYFDKVQNLPFIVEGFKKLSDNIEHLHDVPEVTVNKPIEENKEAPMPPVIIPVNKVNKPIEENKEAPMPPVIIPVNKVNKPIEENQAPVVNTTSDVPLPPAYNNVQHVAKESPIQNAKNNTKKALPPPPPYNNTKKALPPPPAYNTIASS